MGTAGEPLSDDVAEPLRYPAQVTMEIPSTLPVPKLDALKSTGSEGKTQHVEAVSASEGGLKEPEAKEAKLPGKVHETDAEKEKKWFIGSIDQGTTSSRFLIFNGEGNPVASHQIEFENMYPESG